VDEPGIVAGEGDVEASVGALVAGEEVDVGSTDPGDVHARSEASRTGRSNRAPQARNGGEVVTSRRYSPRGKPRPPAAETKV